MGRIGASLSGIERTLLNRLADANAAATLNTLRMATELRINSPSDDPSAFVTLSSYQSRLSVVNTVMSNVTAADSMISQAQAALAEIRTQLETIRSQLITAGSDAQENIDTAIDQINSLAVSDFDGRRLLDGSADFVVSGRNPSQVVDLRIYSTGGAGPIVAEKSAALTYTGSSRYVAADATIELTGDIGSTTISVNTDQTLEDVAEVVNERTITTGVTASVEGNTLTLASSQTGSSADLALVVSSGTFNVSGGNGDGTANGVDAVYGSTPAISGTLQRAATQAQLVYDGSAGQVATTVTLAGSLGETDITVSEGEALSSVEAKINNDSYKTGITASISGTDLVLSSVDYGADVEITVSAAEGTFDVTGGNGDGTANGTDAAAEINGHLISGDRRPELRHRESTGLIAENAQVEVTGHLGSATITLNQNDTLAQAAAAINAESGTTGVVASVDGNDLVISGTQSGTAAQVSIEVASGAFETVTDHTPATVAELTYTGSDGKASPAAEIKVTGNLGFANITITDGESLVSVAADINTETANTGVKATVAGNSLLIRSVDAGSTATVAVEVVSGTFEVSGGNGDGTANGANATAAASGSDGETGYGTVQGNRFTVNQGGFHYEIEFDSNAAGDFDTITVSGEALTLALSTSLANRSTLSIPSLHASQLGGLSGTLDQIASGGPYADLGDNTAQAIRIVDEALADLTQIEGSVDGFYNASVTSASNLLSELQEDIQDAIDQTDGYDENEEALLLAKNQQLAANALSGLAILNQQRSDIVTMIQQIAGLI